jgi:hypothetical protein
VVRKL